MARFVYETRDDNLQGKLFGDTSRATRYLRENFGTSFPSGSVGKLKAGEISQIEVTGKRDGEKVTFLLMRREVQ